MTFDGTLPASSCNIVDGHDYITMASRGPTGDLIMGKVFHLDVNISVTIRTTAMKRNNVKTKAKLKIRQLNFLNDIFGNELQYRVTQFAMSCQDQHSKLSSYSRKTIASRRLSELWSVSKSVRSKSITRSLFPVRSFSSFWSTPEPTPTAYTSIPACLMSRAFVAAFDLSSAADCPSVIRMQTSRAPTRSPPFDWNTPVRATSSPPPMSVVCRLRLTSPSNACRSAMLSCARSSKCILGLSPNVTTLTRRQPSCPVGDWSATKRLMNDVIFVHVSALTLADESTTNARSVFLQSAATTKASDNTVKYHWRRGDERGAILSYGELSWREVTYLKHGRR